MVLGVRHGGSAGHRTSINDPQTYTRLQTLRIVPGPIDICKRRTASQQHPLAVIPIRSRMDEPTCLLLLPLATAYRPPPPTNALHPTQAAADRLDADRQASHRIMHALLHFTHQLRARAPAGRRRAGSACFWRRLTRARAAMTCRLCAVWVCVGGRE